jgi:hypothetical protein
MFKKYFLILSILISSISFFVCQRDSESITGFNDNDTTNNGGSTVRKPNIYIYPTEKINLKVQLKFPHGGKIINSSPQYTNGWDIVVEPSGLINDQFQYLFYEAKIPERLQRRNGWICSGKDLGKFFDKNLSNLLFSEKEISDFLGYWIPLFNNDKTYIIYPHYSRELSDIIEINFNIVPDNIIRVLYLIEEYNGSDNVQNPQVPVYERVGFTVLEWGVVYQ